MYFLLNWDLQPLSTSRVIWSADSYPNLTASGQAFLGQFTSTNRTLIVSLLGIAP